MKNHISKTERHLLILWFIANIAIGLFIVRDFGISYDEPDYYLYAQDTVNAYESFFALAYTPAFGPNDLPNYGPAFIIFPELALRSLKLFFPNIATANVWHFSYFFVFQLGGLCLYILARRWFNPWSAWGILLLYTYQPLLWGHAFINPKDIPFMAFFLFTIWSGFHLADSLGAENIDLSFQTIIKFVWGVITSFIQPTQNPAKSNLTNRWRPVSLREISSFLRSPKLLLAGVLFGMTISIRLLGPLSGLIVILYLAFTLRQKSTAVIIAYVICASVTAFLTWPYLWPNPIDHWMDSLVLMFNFPWPAFVLFNGQFYKSDELPISYLPTLLNIQLTEPLLILIYFGLVVLTLSILRKRIKLDLFLVLFFGAILPLTGLIASRATMYDNFRQILFLLPPLILLAGLALDVVFLELKSVIIRPAVLGILALPGIYAIMQLHPYEYVYYNSFVGGIQGASRRFELDYWCTSYHEAAYWLNSNALTGSKIGGDGPTYLFYVYLRTDLRPTHQSKPDEHYDYFVITSRYNQDMKLYPNAKVVYSIKRSGAVLTVIKQP